MHRIPSIYYASFFVGSTTINTSEKYSSTNHTLRQNEYFYSLQNQTRTRTATTMRGTERGRKKCEMSNEAKIPRQTPTPKRHSRQPQKWKANTAEENDKTHINIINVYKTITGNTNNKSKSAVDFFCFEIAREKSVCIRNGWRLRLPTKFEIQQGFQPINDFVPKRSINQLIN